MIALLCPTRARPEQYERMRKSANATAETEISILGATNCADSEYDSLVHYVNCKFPEDMPTAFMWNTLADLAKRNQNIKLFMLCADDVIFSTPLWDRALIDHYNALENKIHVYHLLDSRNPEGTPHPIVTREYIEAMGYFLPPMFLHWFVDTWTVEIAKANNCFTHMKDYLLVHDKPSDRGQADETHNGIRRMGWHERDKWTNERCQHILEFEKQRLRAHFSKSARAVA